MDEAQLVGRPNVITILPTNIIIQVFFVIIVYWQMATCFNNNEWLRETFVAVINLNGHKSPDWRNSARCIQNFYGVAYHFVSYRLKTFRPQSNQNQTFIWISVFAKSRAPIQSQIQSFSQIQNQMPHFYHDNKYDFNIKCVSLLKIEKVTTIKNTIYSTKAVRIQKYKDSWTTI